MDAGGIWLLVVFNATFLCGSTSSGFRLMFFVLPAVLVRIMFIQSCGITGPLSAIFAVDTIHLVNQLHASFHSILFFTYGFIGPFSFNWYLKLCLFILCNMAALEGFSKRIEVSLSLTVANEIVTWLVQKVELDLWTLGKLAVLFTVVLAYLDAMWTSNKYIGAYVEKNGIAKLFSVTRQISILGVAR
jgi:hypothetical protein